LVREGVAPAPERIARVSGGVLAAAAVVTGRERRLRDTMADPLERSGANPDRHERMDGGPPTPRPSLCRYIAEEVQGDAAAGGMVAEGCPLQVILADPPGPGRVAELTGALATIDYKAELPVLPRPDREWAEAAGLSRSLVEARGGTGGAARGADLRGRRDPVDLRAAGAGRTRGRGGGMSGRAGAVEPDEDGTILLARPTYGN
jgi:hypothetical protein